MASPRPARDPRPAWQQVTETLTEAIRSGILVEGDELPSITELSALQGIGAGVIRHALETLAADSFFHALVRPQWRRGASAADRPASGSGPGPVTTATGWMQAARLSSDEGRHDPRIHSILSGAFAAGQRWEWTDRHPTRSAKPPTPTRRPIPATSPDDVAKVIAEARSRSAALGLYLWLVAVTGVRRGELRGLPVCDIDLDRGLVHIAFNYVVRGGRRVRKDTKTHQDRWLAIDPDTCALIATYLDEIRAKLAAVGVGLRDDAYLFSNDPAHARAWNPDWATHKVAEAADAAAVKLDIKGGRHYTASVWP
jgi:integrase